MALSGLGPALSGAYANVQRALLERKLQQEDLERRRQEALADREAQFEKEMRFQRFLKALSAEERAALAQDPYQIKRREHEEWQMGQERRAPEIAAATARMAHWRTYQPEQILSNPQLREQYLRDFQLATGQPHPTQTRQVVETIPTPSPLVARTGAGAGIQPTTMQIPTGREVTEPIFPQVAPALQRIVVMDNAGKVLRVMEVPEGTQVRTVTPPKPDQPQRFVITDSQGNVVKTLETPPGTQIRVLPAPPRGGAGAGTEGLTPARKRIVDQFNRIDGLAQKAQDKIDDPMMPPNSDQAKSLKARIEGYEKQKTAILRQYPWIGQYVGVGGEPAGGAGVARPSAGQHLTRALIREIASRERVTEAEVEKDAIAQGFTVEPTARPAVTGLAENVVQYKRQGKTWPEARILLIRDLVGRGFTPQQAAKIADTQGRGAYNRSR